MKNSIFAEHRLLGRAGEKPATQPERSPEQTSGENQSELLEQKMKQLEDKISQIQQRTGSLTEKEIKQWEDFVNGKIDEINTKAMENKLQAIATIEACLKALDTVLTYDESQQMSVIRNGGEAMVTIPMVRGKRPTMVCAVEGRGRRCIRFVGQSENGFQWRIVTPQNSGVRAKVTFSDGTQTYLSLDATQKFSLTQSSGVDFSPKTLQRPGPSPTAMPETSAEQPEKPETAPDNRMEVAQDLWKTLQSQIESGHVESVKGEILAKFNDAVRSLPEMDRVKLFEQAGLYDGVVVENNEEGAGQKFRFSVDTNEQVVMTDVVETAPAPKTPAKKKEGAPRTKKKVKQEPSPLPETEAPTSPAKPNETTERTRDPELKGALDQLEFHLSAGHGMGTEVDAALRRLNDSLKGKTREQRMAALVAVGLASEQVSTDTNLTEQRLTSRTVKDENNNVEYRIFTDLEGSTVQVEVVEPTVQRTEASKETRESDSALLKKAQELFGTRIDVLEKDGGSGAVKLVEAVNALIDQMTDAAKETVADTLMGGRKTVTYVNGEKYNVRFTTTPDGHIALDDLANVDAKLTPEIRRGYMDAVAALRSGEDVKAAQGILDGITNAALVKMTPEGRARVLDQVFGKVGMEFNEGTFHVKFTHDRTKVTIEDLTATQAESSKPTERREAQPSAVPDGVDTNVDINNPESVARDLERRVLGRYEGAEREFPYVPLRVGFAGKDAKGRNVYRITSEESTEDRNATMSKVVTYATKHGLVAPGTTQSDAGQLEVTITGFEKGFGYTGPWHKQEQSPAAAPTSAPEMGVEDSAEVKALMKDTNETYKAVNEAKAQVEVNSDYSRPKIEAWVKAIDAFLKSAGMEIMVRAGSMMNGTNNRLEKLNKALAAQTAKRAELVKTYLMDAPQPSRQPESDPGSRVAERAERGRLVSETRAPQASPEPTPAAPKENGDLSRENAELRRQIAELTKRIEELLARIKALEDQQRKPGTPEQPATQPPASPGEQPKPTTQTPTEEPKPKTNPERQATLEQEISKLKAERAQIDTDWKSTIGQGYDALHRDNDAGFKKLDAMEQRAKELDAQIAQKEAELNALKEGREAPSEDVDQLIAERTTLNQSLTTLGLGKTKEREEIRLKIEAVDKKLAAIRTSLDQKLTTLSVGSTEERQRITTTIAKIDAVLPREGGTTPSAPETTSEDPVAKLPALERAKFEAATTEWSTIGAVGAVDLKGVPYLYRKASVTVNGVKETRLFAYGESGYHTLDPKSGEWKKLETTDAMITEASLTDAPAKYAALPNKPDSIPMTERMKFNSAGTEWARIGAAGSLDKAGIPFLYRKAMVTVNGVKTARLFAYTEKAGYFVMNEKGAWTQIKPQDPMIAEAGIGNAQEAYAKLDNTSSSMPETERRKFNAATTVWSRIGASGAKDAKGNPFLYVKADIPTGEGQSTTRLFAYTELSGYNVMDAAGKWTKIPATDPLIAQAKVGNGAERFAALKKETPAVA